MDGERKKCPIVPANIINLRFGEGEDDVLTVSPTHDCIQMFPDEKYNYLRYFNPEQGQLVAIWLGHDVLADLVDEGIPLCLRSEITEQEVELYEQHIGKVAMMGMSNCIDLEEAVDELTDAEITYFMREWTE